MRSHIERRQASTAPPARSPAIVAAALFVVTIGMGAASAQRESRPADVGGPGPDEIARALDRVKADPNLRPERTITTLRWKRSAETSPSDMFASLRWIGSLFRWLDQSARLLVWVAAVMVAALLGIQIVRAVRRRDALREEETPFVVPSYVRDMDIRPESLPEDIGATARLLWDRGAQRAALALLYRGMLSRLAHVHGIPIRDSTTEGDCLALTAAYLADGGREYTTRLVRVWQRFVYGGQETQSVAVYVLCQDFSSALDSAPRLSAAQPAGPS